jgi:hypothetical protein
MVNESTIVVIVCVSFVNVIPKLSGRMDFGNKFKWTLFPSLPSSCTLASACPRARRPGPEARMHVPSLGDFDHSAEITPQWIRVIAAE